MLLKGLASDGFSLPRPCMILLDSTRVDCFRL